MSVLNIGVTLDIIHCASCGIVFGVPADFIERRRKDNAEFRCPAGHVNVYRENAFDKLKKENDRLRSQVEHERNSREVAARLHKTALTGERIKRGKAEAKAARIETRVNAGVCPHCQRTFQQLARHMQSKHPTSAAHSHGVLV